MLRRLHRVVSIRLIVLLAVLAPRGAAIAYPVRFTDTGGHEVTIARKPERVVSLVPSVTAMIFAIGAGDALQGVTYHTTRPAEVSKKHVVGGFFDPSLRSIKELNPDVVFLSRLHKKAREGLAGAPCQLIQLDDTSITDLYEKLTILGRIFDREQQAADVIQRIKDELNYVARKVAKIPEPQRLRVIRLMGADTVMTPGDDSFMGEQIRAAGGIPPTLNKKGAVVTVTQEEWTRFNPQVIYGCDRDREVADRFFNEPGWRDVDAVRNKRIYYFPATLTCCASVHTGEFVTWLASRLYTKQFAEEGNWVSEQKAVGSRPVDVKLDYVASARVVRSMCFDFACKSLVVDFTQPMQVVSTLEGPLSGIAAVGNHYSPPPCWDISHCLSLQALKKHVCASLGKPTETASLLYTGADMDHLSAQRTEYKEMVAYALVTAGVRSNAMRVSVDEGSWYEPGTINIIVLTNRRLTPAAMTRAIICATEAKTAALQDLDTRSTYRPEWQATGTGTDSAIVVEGTGSPLDGTGGHTKMGELISRAVHAGVMEAVYRQNGMTPGRNVFLRLQERKIDIYRLAMDCSKARGGRGMNLTGGIEHLLLDARYASFLQSSFALSDACEEGLVSDLRLHEDRCRRIAEEIGGAPIEKMDDLVSQDNIPKVTRMALNALLNGLCRREERRDK